MSSTSSSLSTFSESLLTRRLSELNGSAQSIQQTSQWLIQHNKHHSMIVKCWLKELESRASASRKLPCLYLANDVVQNCRKKYPKLALVFGSVMTKAMANLASIDPVDAKTLKDVARLVGIWRERKIFETAIQADIDKVWKNKMAKSEQKDQPTPTKRSNNNNNNNKESASSRKKSRLSSSTSVETSSVPTTQSATTTSQEELLLLSPGSTSPGLSTESVDSNALLKAMNELEHSASADGVVREKIARLPSAVSDISQLPKVKSGEEGEQLLKEIKEASSLLTTYNERLEQELKDRKHFSKMLQVFIYGQRAREAQTEEKLEEYKEKLERAKGIRDELRLHVQSLPDLSKLPDVTQGTLPPLPSAGDLFTLK